MHLHLRPALPSDAAALTEIYLSSFSTDPISLLVFPRSDASSYKFWHSSIISEISAPNSYFLCIVDQGSTGEGQIVAYAKWNYITVEKEEKEGEEAELPEWPKEADTEFAEFFFGTLERKRREIMHCGDKRGREGYYYLELVATKPEYQGKGAGGMLINWGVEKADREGKEAYLESSPVGKRVYERFGFGEVERFVVGLKERMWEGKRDKGGWEEEYVEVFMVREVKKAREDSVRS